MQHTISNMCVEVTGNIVKFWNNTQKKYTLEVYENLHNKYSLSCEGSLLLLKIW